MEREAFAAELRARAFAWLFFLALFFTPVARATTLEEIDEVAAKAGSVEALLGNQALLDEYYQRLAEYYGPAKFPRSSFDAIIGQLRQAGPRVPGLYDRLWETTNLGDPFSIEIDLKSRGLELKSDEWVIEINAVKTAAEMRAADIRKLTVKEQRELVQRTIHDAEKRMAAFEEAQKTLPRAQRGEHAKAFYQTGIFETPNIREVSAFLLAEELSHEGTRDLLLSGDADVVLDALDELRARESFRFPGIKVDPALRRWIMKSGLPEVQLPKLEVVPNPETGKAEPASTKFFTVKTKTSRSGNLVPEGTLGKGSIFFRPPPRRLHGIWKGVSIHECVGGSCHSLGYLTPERWATVAIRDSMLLHAEREGSYHGFVHAVPMEHQGKIYASLDLGAPVLTKDTIVSGKKSKLYSVFLPHLAATLPKNWEGLALSNEGGAIANAGVLPVAHGNASFRFGRELGPSGDFKQLDPMTAQIVKIAPKDGLAAHYGGNMVLEVPANKNKGVVLLKTPLAAKDLRKLGSEEYLLKILDAKDAGQKARGLAAIEKSGMASHISLSLASFDRVLSERTNASDEGSAAVLTKILKNNPVRDPGLQEHILRQIAEGLKSSPEGAKNAADLLSLLDRKLRPFPVELVRPILEALAVHPGGNHALFLLSENESFANAASDKVRLDLALRFLKDEQHRTLFRYTGVHSRIPVTRAKDQIRLVRETRQEMRVNQWFDSGTGGHLYPAELALRTLTPWREPDLQAVIRELSDDSASADLLWWLTKNPGFTPATVPDEERLAQARAFIEGRENRHMLKVFPVTRPSDQLLLLREVQKIEDDLRPYAEKLRRHLIAANATALTDPAAVALRDDLLNKILLKHGTDRFGFLGSYMNEESLAKIPWPDILAAFRRQANEARFGMTEGTLGYKMQEYAQSEIRRRPERALDLLRALAEETMSYPESDALLGTLTKTKPSWWETVQKEENLLQRASAARKPSRDGLWKLLLAAPTQPGTGCGGLYDNLVH